MSAKHKIINDPVYGFITINHPLLFQVINHPYYQRLRRIYQMAFAHLVYPGAVHTRLHHALGAYHLMCNALYELSNKGVDITEEEALGAKIAILLHDVGHGPFSHALENELIQGVHHEDISRMIMEEMNHSLKGSLDTALAIFNDEHPKHFLHQLVSGQLDVDRMDYLNRDSFFTGVAEGVIGSDRIIKMLAVNNGELVVEEKGIYSVEKFLVSRRLMYWQVYLHKTVVSAEMMLVKIIRRARHLVARGIQVEAASATLNYFLHNLEPDIRHNLDRFCRLDDVDIMCTIKCWMTHPDKVLNFLCRSLINRNLFKVQLQSEPVSDDLMMAKKKESRAFMDFNEEEIDYVVFRGEAINTMYNPYDEKINILFKNGQVKDISQVDNALIHQTLSRQVKKFYICYPGAW